MIKHLIFSCVFIFIGNSNLFGQNLVLNGDFEDYEVCPESSTVTRGNISAYNISSPTQSSPDYFNSCAQFWTNYSVPNNCHGNQISQSGKGYMGIDIEKIPYFEYIQCSLTEPLVEGKVYIVEYYISLSESSKYCARDFGFVFSENKLFYQIINSLKLIPDFVDHAHICEFHNWYKITSEFTAKGGEMFLVLGSFSEEINLIKQNLKKPGKAKRSYYYLDTVSVIEKE